MCWVFAGAAIANLLPHKESFTIPLSAKAGAQLAAINLSEGYLKGAQLGFYNQAESLTGVQLGFVNNVKNIHGLQIGLVNIAKNGWFPVMVLVNGRF